MTLSLRALLIAAAVPLVIFAIIANLGFYTPAGMILMLFAGLFLVVAALRRDQPLRLSQSLASLLLYVPLAVAAWVAAQQALHTTQPLMMQIAGFVCILTVIAGLLAYLRGARAQDPLTGVLLGLGVLSATLAVFNIQLRYPDLEATAAVGPIIFAAALLAYLVWLSFLARPQPARRTGWHLRWALLLVAGLTCRGLAIVGSPDPVIDVNDWMQNAPRFFLSGENPYDTDFVSPYGTERARSFGIDMPRTPRPPRYFPLTILTGIPPVLLGLDVRWLNVLCEGLAALFLLIAGRRTGAPERGILVSAIYLSLPRSPFMIEQAWLEPQMAVLGAIFLIWSGSRPWLSGIALGGFVAIKQTSVLLLPSLIVALRRQRLVLIVGAAVAALVILPFFLWNPQAFWWMNLTGYMIKKPYNDSLILSSLFFNEFGVSVPPTVFRVMGAILLGLLAWKTPVGARPATALWLAASLFVVAMSGFQGYFNYYWLVLFLMLMALVDGEEKQAPEAEA